MYGEMNRRTKHINTINMIKVATTVINGALGRKSLSKNMNQVSRNKEL